MDYGFYRRGPHIFHFSGCAAISKAPDFMPGPCDCGAADTNPKGNTMPTITDKRFWLPAVIVGGSAATLMFLFAPGMTFWIWVVASLVAGAAGGFGWMKITDD